MKGRLCSTVKRHRAAFPVFAVGRFTVTVLRTKSTLGHCSGSNSAPMRKPVLQSNRVGLVGSGSPPEPQGILGTNGIKQVTNVGAIATYAKVLEGVRLLLESNLSLEVATRYAVMSPRQLVRV